MKILLLGKDGQVGWELQRTLAPLGDLAAHDRRSCDLADPQAVRAAFDEARPQAVINAAAYNAVDQAESEPGLAMQVNGEAPGLLAEESARAGAILVHYSTDFVFDGEKASPYQETDPPNPLSAYGRSKLAGEQAVLGSGASALVLRTSWVYSLRRDSFVTKVLAWSRRSSELRIVTDQVGSPTSARMLAELTAQVLAQAMAAGPDWLRARTGLYHLGGAGEASRYDWAQAILAHDPQPEAQRAAGVVPASARDFPTPAARPRYSALDCSKFAGAFGLRLPPWERALQMEMEASAARA